MRRTFDKTVSPNKITNITYIRDAVYRNDTLQFFGNSESRIRSNSAKTGWIYDYFLRDHLDNTRMMITDDYNVTSPILEANSYYPFGLQQKEISLVANNSLHNFKNTFQKQEINEDLGFDIYEFKYRMDDPQIGRFWQIDPLSEKFVHNSTYSFSENKVTGHVELEGLESAMATMWRSAGITKSTGDEIVADVKRGIEKGGRMAKDVLTISGGVTAIVASGGTAAPAYVLVSGGISIAGGSTKLVLNAMGNDSRADEIPTTISGTAIFTINEIGGKDSKGNKLISQQFQSTVELAEGVLSLDFKDFSKFSTTLEKTKGTIEAVSIIIDAGELSSDAKEALIELFKSGTPTAKEKKPVNDHTEDSKSISDTEKRLEFFENNQRK